MLRKRKPNFRKSSRLNLLIIEINFQKARFKIQKNEFDLLHNELRNVLNCIGVANICSFFLGSNYAKSHYSVHQKELNVLFKNYQPKLYPDRVIFNYSKASVSDVEKSLLVKELLRSITLVILPVFNYFKRKNFRCLVKYQFKLTTT